MITKKDLQDYARLRGLSLGNAEKDYLIDIALLSISRHTKNELVFKGGTCLYKFHKLNRFSEDIDFSATKEVDINSLIYHMILDFQKYGIKAVQHKKKEPYNSVLITLRVEGPLYAGKSSTYANLGIDINLKSEVIIGPESLNYGPLYPEIPTIHILCMKPEEIFSEKIRAIMTRNRARDLFDLHFLMEGGIYATPELLNKKMEYYNDIFDAKKLLARLNLFEPYWKKELRGFTPILPDFQSAKKEVEAKLIKIYMA